MISFASQIRPVTTTLIHNNISALNESEWVMRIWKYFAVGFWRNESNAAKKRESFCVWQKMINFFGFVDSTVWFTLLLHSMYVFNRWTTAPIISSTARITYYARPISNELWRKKKNNNLIWSTRICNRIWNSSHSNNINGNKTRNGNWNRNQIRNCIANG